MILSDTGIREALHSGNLRIDPLPTDGSIQPASVDVHLSNRFLRFADDQLLDTRLPPVMEEVIVSEGECLMMMPNSFYIASTLERLTLPADLAARLEGKSKLARYGLLIHAAGFFDPGFRGTGTLEIKNLSGMIQKLWPGDKIGQFSFQPLTSPAARPYGHPGLGSHYAGQSGPTAARP